MQSSHWKPNVSYNSNAFTPASVVPFSSSITLSTIAILDLKSQEDASSSRITFVTNCCCDLISGKNSHFDSPKRQLID
jgi:hypothetical protein